VKPREYSNRSEYKAYLVKNVSYKDYIEKLKDTSDQKKAAIFARCLEKERTKQRHKPTLRWQIFRETITQQEAAKMRDVMKLRAYGIEWPRLWTLIQSVRKRQRHKFVNVCRPPKDEELARFPDLVVGVRESLAPPSPSSSYGFPSASPAPAAVHQQTTFRQPSFLTRSQQTTQPVSSQTLRPRQTQASASAQEDADNDDESSDDERDSDSEYEASECGESVDENQRSANATIGTKEVQSITNDTYSNGSSRETVDSDSAENNSSHAEKTVKMGFVVDDGGKNPMKRPRPATPCPTILNQYFESSDESGDERDRLSGQSNSSTIVSGTASTVNTPNTSTSKSNIPRIVLFPDVDEAGNHVSSNTTTNIQAQTKSSANHLQPVASNHPSFIKRRNRTSCQKSSPVENRSSPSATIDCQSIPSPRKDSSIVTDAPIVDEQSSRQSITEREEEEQEEADNNDDDDNDNDVEESDHPSSPSPNSSRLTKKRRATGLTSPYFPKKPKRSKAGQSCITVPPISAPQFGLIQEKLYKDPWRMIMALPFLSKTSGKASIPVYYEVMALYPTVDEMCSADVNVLADLCRSLGFQNHKAKTLLHISRDYRDFPPQIGRRTRVLNYPQRGAGKVFKPNTIVDFDAEDCAGALEIAHIKGLGPYAYDSWRIFCRDIFRNVATGYNGEGSGKGTTVAKDFEPEWKRVLPQDKELKACLRWMWLKEGIVWDPDTGEKKPADEDTMIRARMGETQWVDYNTDQERDDDEVSDEILNSRERTIHVVEDSDSMQGVERVSTQSHPVIEAGHLVEGSNSTTKEVQDQEMINQDQNSCHKESPKGCTQSTSEESTRLERDDEDDLTDDERQYTLYAYATQDEIERRRQQQHQSHEDEDQDENEEDDEEEEDEPRREIEKSPSISAEKRREIRKGKQPAVDPVPTQSNNNHNSPEDSAHNNDKGNNNHRNTSRSETPVHSRSTSLHSRYISDPGPSHQPPCLSGSAPSQSSDAISMTMDEVNELMSANPTNRQQSKAARKREAKAAKRKKKENKRKRKRELLGRNDRNNHQSQNHQNTGNDAGEDEDEDDDEVVITKVKKRKCGQECRSRMETVELE